jgi:hypothetical protein
MRDKSVIKMEDALVESCRECASLNQDKLFS